MPTPAGLCACEMAPGETSPLERAVLKRKIEERGKTSRKKTKQNKTKPKKKTNKALRAALQRFLVPISSTASLTPKLEGLGGFV